MATHTVDFREAWVVAEIESKYPNPFRIVDGLDKSSDPFTGLITPGIAPDLIPDGSVNPYAGKDLEVRAQAERKERRRREAKFKQNRAPVMSQCAHLSGDEVAIEVARRATERHARLAIKPDIGDRRRVAKDVYGDWVQDLATLAMVKVRIGGAVPPGLTL